MKFHSVLLSLCILLGVSLSFPVPGTGAQLYVDDDNLTGIEDGSVLHPHNTIQEAVAAASQDGGDTILVAAGSYTGNVSIENRTVHLFGGYPGGTSADYENGSGGVFTGQDITTYVTQIQGDGTSAVVALVDAGSSTIDGCRIIGGSGFTNPWKSLGGGVYVSGGSPTVSRNTIENNNVLKPNSTDLTTLGGGIYSENSDIWISDNLVRNNSAGGGGGIAIDSGNVVIAGNTVQGNKAYDFSHGGGLLVSSPDASVTNNRFIQNEVGRDQGFGWGGGVVIYGEESHAVLSNNTYTGNYAGTAGGGLFIDDASQASIDHELIYNNESTRNGAGIYVDGAWDELGSTATMNHCTVADNICTDCPLPGLGIAVEYYSNVTVKNSIFWGNGGDDFYADDTSSLTVSYTLSQETFQGQGNLNSDPLFADAAAWDYHVKSSAGRWYSTGDTGGEWLTDSFDSPGIDAGEPNSGYILELDSNGGRANMGAYGNTAEASKSGSTAVDPETIYFSGFTMSENSQVNTSVTITVNALEKNSSVLYYRFSTHPDYGTSGYDGKHWQSMTSTEYQILNSCNYIFDSVGKSIVVVWVTASGTDNVDPTGIPIIGWSVDTSGSDCKTNFTGVTITGEQKVNKKMTFAVNAENSCDNSKYYRFSMHPYYGTNDYDGTHWESMTSAEWISSNSTDYTFTESGKYIVVAWITDDPTNYDSNGIPIIGWSVYIE